MKSPRFPDRLVHVLLEEVLGGDTPPDFTEAILARAARGTPAVVSPSRSVWRWLAPLAAAASILAVTGILLMRESGSGTGANVHRYAMGRLVRQAGTVAVADRTGADGGMFTDIRTGSGAGCQVELADQSAVAVGEDTQLTWRRDPATKGQVLELAQGQAYLDLKKQTAPFAVSTARMRTEVLGTKFLVSRGKEELVSVAVGQTRMDLGNSEAVIHAGQTAMIWSGGGAASLLVSWKPLRPELVSWLDSLGTDSAEFRRLQQGDAGRPRGLPRVLGDFYQVVAGSWDIRDEESGMVAIQSRVTGTNSVIFGGSVWTQGVFSCKARVLSDVTGSNESRAGIYFMFRYPGGSADSLGAQKTLAEMLHRGPVICMEAAFVSDLATDKLVARRVSFWNEADPTLRWDFNNWVRSPQNSQYIKKRGPAAVGVQTRGCAVEFSQIELKDAQSVKVEK